MPGTLGTAFGFIFTVRGDDQFSLTARYLHPPMANALTREITTTREIPLSVRPGETQALSWVFTREWEIAPGPWTLQLWEGGKKLAEKKFTVTKAADIYAHLGEWGRRLPALNATLAKDPKDVKSAYGLGQRLFRNGRVRARAFRIHQSHRSRPQSLSRPITAVATYTRFRGNLIKRSPIATRPSSLSPNMRSRSSIAVRFTMVKAITKKRSPITRRPLN